MRSFKNESGFTITEMLVSVAIMLTVSAATLTMFKNALDINETANQLGDANQNLRAGTNQLLKDLMMAGRIIANGGVPVPNGTGAQAVTRPGPPASALTFSTVADDDGTIMLPSITTGFELGPTINGEKTDIVTILTVDEFQPVLQGIGSGTPTGHQAMIAANGSQLTLPATSPWMVGDAVNDTPAIVPGDIILFKNSFGMAAQTVTTMTQTVINFATNDPFKLNQRGTSLKGTVFCIKTETACDTLPVASAVQSAAFPATSLFRLMMITYYVDATTTPGTPRLTRRINQFDAQALAGVVEDLEFSYDLVDPSSTSNAVTAIDSLPFTLNGTTFTANMIKKVNVHVGVRSESMSKPTGEYVRNHVTTAVGVRSLASVDRYDTSQ